jgi:hypothetical protein
VLKEEDRKRKRTRKIKRDLQKGISGKDIM